MIRGVHTMFYERSPRPFAPSSVTSWAFPPTMSGVVGSSSICLRPTWVAHSGRETS